MIGVTNSKVFISYNHSDKSLAERIESDIEVIGLQIIRDDRELKYTDDIESYMKSIRYCDYALVLVSDSFLKSVACMYEICEFFKDDNFRERILPIIIEDYFLDDKKQIGARIYNNSDITSYITYWEKQESELRDKLKEIDVLNMKGLVEELSRIKEIQRMMGEFIFTMRKMKHITFEKIISNQYSDLLEKIGLKDKTIKDIRNSRVFFSRAMSEISYEKRIEYLSQSIELNPYAEQSYNQIGRTLDNLNKYNEAIENYNKAIRINPKEVTYYVNRSYSYIRMNEFYLALNDLNKAIEIDPNERMSYNNRADIYRRIGKYDLAIEDINHALKIDPNFDLAYATLAEVYATKSDFLNFFKHLRTAIDLGYPLFRYSFDEIYKHYEGDDEFRKLIEVSKKNDRFI